MKTVIGPITLHAKALDEVWLENSSAAPQYVMHDLHLQPSRLRLYRMDGSEVVSFDERAREKFDTRAYLPMYEKLPPGGKLALFKARITRHDSDVCELDWGPYTFHGLKPGRYDAVLDWTSERDDYTDEDGRRKKLDGVWLGTVRSERFIVTLP